MVLSGVGLPPPHSKPCGVPTPLNNNAGPGTGEIPHSRLSTPAAEGRPYRQIFSAASRSNTKRFFVKRTGSRLRRMSFSAPRRNESTI